MTGALIWLAWGVVGLGIETYALLTHGDRSPAGQPTLTHLLLTHVPRWIIAAFLGWLTYHLLKAS